MSDIRLAIQAWRTSLKADQAALQQLFMQNHHAGQLIKKLSMSMDDLLSQVWHHFAIDNEVCLIAVGGYGRQELFPYSDIDLLILLPEHLVASQSEKIESLIGALWDIGLNVGHSVRTQQECISEAQQDVTVLTNLLESRLICGPKQRYVSFAQATRDMLQPASFLEKKLKEQQQRHAKFNDTAYNLEPNIKESPGGLRDLNMVLWIANSQNIGTQWSDLAKAQIISADELKLIRRHENNLKNLRVRLHYLAKRREDRLLFDFQNELAANLGLSNNSKKRASEQLMYRYYESVKFISLSNELLLKTFQANSITVSQVVKLNSHFAVKDGLLMANHAELFKEYPEAILQSFYVMQTHPDILGFSAELIRALQLAKKSIDHQFRQNSHNKTMFLNILSHPHGVNNALINMNRYGVLGQYIPAFGKIIGQMQHDLFHVYTVDEHILNVLCNLRRFSKPELSHEFPLCSKLFAVFDKPYLLYLAALFHDIAKGRGGDHSDLGTVDARRFCKLHGLPKPDTELVAWLVQSHLKMSSTAQKTDLSDPEIIIQFAQFVGSEYRLTALYLLTVADIRGTSPAVWNAWKARLLESLYQLTLNVLRTQATDSKAQIQQRKQAASQKLTAFGIKPASINRLWDSFGEHYFVRFDGDEIAWHSRILMPHQHTDKPIVRARLSPKGDGIQVLIYSKDRNDIFARICQFFESMHYSIGQAKILITEHGYALDDFIVLEQSTKQVSYSGLLKLIEAELTKNIEHNQTLAAPVLGRVNRQVKHMPIKTNIRLTADVNSRFHHLEIIANDRPGLLAQIAQQFLTHQVALHNAKINTLGNRVEDSFLISANNGQPLTAERLQNLATALDML